MKPATRATSAQRAVWALLGCPSCLRQLQLKWSALHGYNVRPWLDPIGANRLPCLFCMADGNTRSSLELEPAPGEPRRCLWLGAVTGKAIDGTTPKRARRTTVAHRVGCRQCRRAIYRKAVGELGDTYAEAASVLREEEAPEHLSHAPHSLPLEASIPGGDQL